MLAGAVAGIAGGCFGVGGGVVMIPILTGALALTQHQAHGTSLAVMGITALVSILVYAAHGNVAWLTALLIAVTSVATARYGARLAKRTPAGRLTRIFAAFLVVVAARLLWRAPHGLEPAVHAGAASVVFLLALGLAVGLLAGYMGVGGGILIVPALTLLVGMPQQLAQGTSLAVILAAAPAGALEHARHGNVVGGLVPMLAVGAAAGGVLASFLVQGLPSAVLARAFAFFLLFNAAQTWLRAGRAGRSAAPVSGA
jgi:uncharacterized membrane protein YfcA